MKKLFLSLFAFLALAGYVKAGTEDWNNVAITSYTEASTVGPVLFTSATIQWVAVTISSPAPNSYLAIYRSTSASFTADITTQALISTGASDLTGDGAMTIPLYEMRNTSFTYWNKSGNAKLILWYRYPPMPKGRAGNNPGLSGSGNNTTKILYP